MTSFNIILSMGNIDNKVADMFLELDHGNPFLVRLGGIMKVGLGTSITLIALGSFTQMALLTLDCKTGKTLDG